MNLCDTSLPAKTDYRRVQTERLSHPKDGALAQRPKAERAPHSAVVRPQAAGKSRSTSLTLVGGFVSSVAGRLVLTMVTWSKRDSGQNLGEGAKAVDRFAVASSPEHKECWFKPTPRGTVFYFLVQDRLRASDVLHRDWNWSRWL